MRTVLIFRGDCTSDISRIDIIVNDVWLHFAARSSLRCASASIVLYNVSCVRYMMCLMAVSSTEREHIDEQHNQ